MENIILNKQMIYTTRATFNFFGFLCCDILISVVDKRAYPVCQTNLYYAYLSFFYFNSKHVTWSLEKKDSSKHQTKILSKKDQTIDIIVLYFEDFSSFDVFNLYVEGGFSPLLYKNSRDLNKKDTFMCLLHIIF
ncbi:hypothetical protein ACJX0J_010037 [Zea mays]